MKIKTVDLMIVGAGPVGLMCAYLAQLCGLSTAIVDMTEGPLDVGRADAYNARTQQLLEIAGLFGSLYPQGATCNTISVWDEGKFISRQSAWWDELEGCFHKHFLMLGQPHLEALLDTKLTALGAAVMRRRTVCDVRLNHHGCLTTLSSGEKIQSSYLIGADGSRSFIRHHFNIPFHIVRPRIVWAVIDGVIESDFPKVQDIIVFQAETSDVAWIPRERDLDRFYVRMDTKHFTLEQVIAKINRAIRPHQLSFKQIVWFSQFSVKESVAEKFFDSERIFLAGDACHVHSVNGGQGLNTGLSDAFNLIWKLNMVIKHDASPVLLQSYEDERKPVAHSVIESSGKLVRSTRDSLNGTHAKDYVKIIEQRSGNVTGMGIRYGTDGLPGTRLFDMEIFIGDSKTRLYSLLDYSQFTLLIFGQSSVNLALPDHVQVIRIDSKKCSKSCWTTSDHYRDQALLVRPDAYIESCASLEHLESLLV